MTRPFSSSGIFLKGDRQPHIAGTSELSSIPGYSHQTIIPFSGDGSNTILNNVSRSGPSFGASSLITDANSGHSGGAILHRNASFHTDYYMRLPTSPISFTSNNISISGSSFTDGSSVLQQGTNPKTLHSQQNAGSRLSNTLIEESDSISPQQKKSRLDVKQEDILQQQVLQQLLQRHDEVNMQKSNSQLQAIAQLRQQREQQQLLQSMPSIQRVQLLQQQQQQQLLRQQGMLPGSGVRRLYDGGVCSRRLMQYLYHQRERPAENTIGYWRKFVAEYYSPRAKKRWCLALYDNVGLHSLGVFPQVATDAWQCDICGSRSGKGFEATFEVLPRLNEINFGSGVIDELLVLMELPREYRFPSGLMMLEFGKAVQESVYEQLRVVREGHLRIVFTPDLKILSWEFCARSHEELLPRHAIVPQVKHLLQVAQKCQTTIAEGVSQSDLQASSVMVVTAGRQLARSLELQSINDLGFSKRFVRCLQIAEVVSSMKDLMDFCKQHKLGPLEGLKNLSKNASNLKTQMQKAQETEGDEPEAAAVNSQHLVALAGSAQAALALTNYQNSLMNAKTQNTTNQNMTQASSSSGTSTGTVQSQRQQNPSSNTPQQQTTSQGSGQVSRQQIMQHVNKNISISAGNKPGSTTGLPSSHSFDAGGSPVHSRVKGSNLTRDLHLPDDFVADIAREFSDNAFFFSDFDDNMNFSWKE